RGSHPLSLGEDRVFLPHAVAQLEDRVVTEGMAYGIGQHTNNPPILARFAGREHGTARQLDASLGVDVGAVLFGVGGSRQHNVGALRATVAVMPLVNHKGGAETAGVDLIGTKEVENLHVARVAPRDNGF